LGGALTKWRYFISRRCHVLNHFGIFRQLLASQNAQLFGRAAPHRKAVLVELLPSSMLGKQLFSRINQALLR
jgi:hypothetical protein